MPRSMAVLRWARRRTRHLTLLWLTAAAFVGTASYAVVMWLLEILFRAM